MRFGAPHGDRVPLVRDRVDHRQHDVAVRQLGDDQLVGAFREELCDAGHQNTPMWPDPAGAGPVCCRLENVAGWDILAVRNWDLDENGLGSLLFDGQRLRFNGKERSATRVRSAHFLPGMERSGRLLPALEDSGRLLPGMEYSGRLLPDMARGRRPL